MSNTTENTIPHEKPKKTPRRRLGLAAAGIAALGILAVGAAGGAGAMKMMGPTVEMAPMAPVAISAMPDDSLVTIKGTVAEIFGNKFVLEDASGRMLVETGRAGEGGKLIAPNEAITVQGRFDDGFLKASFIVHPDGKTEAIRGPGGPGKDGPRHGKGSDRDGPRHDKRDGPRAEAPPAPADGPATDAVPAEGPTL